MNKNSVMLITGTRKGIGKSLVNYYTQKGFEVIGCSRKDVNFKFDNYTHFCLDVCDENSAIKLFNYIYKYYNRLDVLINNASIASMNYCMLTPLSKVREILNTNVIGTFLFCREAGKLMKRNNLGRIVNVTSIGTQLNLEGEAAYTASKAAVESFTRGFAIEYAKFNITVNAIGPTPIKTDLIKSISQNKIDSLIQKLPIKRYSEFTDIYNVIDFFISKKSDFITGQTIFLGGV